MQVLVASDQSKRVVRRSSLGACDGGGKFFRYYDPPFFIYRKTIRVIGFRGRPNRLLVATTTTREVRNEEQEGKGSVDPHCRRASADGGQPGARANRNNVDINVLRNVLNNSINKNDVLGQALQNANVNVSDVVAVNVLSGGHIVVFTR